MSTSDKILLAVTVLGVAAMWASDMLNRYRRKRNHTNYGQVLRQRGNAEFCAARVRHYSDPNNYPSSNAPTWVQVRWYAHLAEFYALAGTGRYNA